MHCVTCTLHKFSRFFLLVTALAALSLAAGCPPTTPEPDPHTNGGDTSKPGWNQAEYERGFNEGFLVDDEYWRGFDESYDTRDAGPMYYSGGEISYVESPEYDAGYWDGVWYAYNDGYFVEYDYAFTVGFSEGYDLAFAADWLAFLSSDQHVEYYDGGFSDGYNDGFSEGRVLGAYDYSGGLPYDWLDAMMFYREGNDVQLENIDLGTGQYGPVELYEYGTDPNVYLQKGADKFSNPARRGTHPIPSIRKKNGAVPEKFDAPAISYRNLPGNESERFNIAPATSPRSATELRVKDTTWLQRIEAYRAALGK